jgi:hypothetical protein
VTRDVCGLCWCPYGDDGECGCTPPAPSAEPVAWMYQHKETARTTLRTADDRMADGHVRKGSWAEMPLYLASPPAHREAMRLALEALSRFMDDSPRPSDALFGKQAIAALRAAIGSQ